MGLVGNGWANCFRTHNELTMGLPGKYPLAPSGSVELRRRIPCIRRRLWQTHSRDRRTLVVCTPTQLSWHLLSLNGQLGRPIFVLLKTHHQQDALFPLPANILPVTIHPFLMLSIHPCDLILQVVDDCYRAGLSSYSQLMLNSFFYFSYFFYPHHFIIILSHYHHVPSPLFLLFLIHDSHQATGRQDCYFAFGQGPLFLQQTWWTRYVLRDLLIWSSVRNVTKIPLFSPNSLIFLDLCFVILFRSPSLR